MTRSEAHSTRTCSCDLARIELAGYSTIVPRTVAVISPAPLYWECPGCGKCWHRYEPEHPLYAYAEHFVERANGRPPQ